jgi:hypothetical protein
MKKTRNRDDWRNNEDYFFSCAKLDIVNDIQTMAFDLYIKGASSNTETEKKQEDTPPPNLSGWCQPRNSRYVSPLPDQTLHVFDATLFAKQYQLSIHGDFKTQTIQIGEFHCQFYQDFLEITDHTGLRTKIDKPKKGIAYRKDKFLLDFSLAIREFINTVKNAAPKLALLMVGPLWGQQTKKDIVQKTRRLSCLRLLKLFNLRVDITEKLSVEIMKKSAAYRLTRITKIPKQDLITLNQLILNDQTEKAMEFIWASKEKSQENNKVYDDCDISQKACLIDGNKLIPPALIAATRKNNLRLVKFLVGTCQVDVNMSTAQERYNYTAVMVAAACGHLGIMQYLRTNGANMAGIGQDPIETDFLVNILFRYNPYMLAIKNNQTKTAASLRAKHGRFLNGASVQNLTVFSINDIANLINPPYFSLSFPSPSIFFDKENHPTPVDAALKLLALRCDDYRFQSACRTAALIPILVDCYRRFSTAFTNPAIRLEISHLAGNAFLIKHLQITAIMTLATIDDYSDTNAKNFLKLLDVRENIANDLSDAIKDSFKKTPCSLFAALLKDAVLIEKFSDENNAIIDLCEFALYQWAPCDDKKTDALDILIELADNYVGFLKTQNISFSSRLMYLEGDTEQYTHQHKSNDTPIDADYFQTASNDIKPFFSCFDNKEQPQNVDHLDADTIKQANVLTAKNLNPVFLQHCKDIIDQSSSNQEQPSNPEKPISSTDLLTTLKNTPPIPKPSSNESPSTPTQKTTPISSHKSALHTTPALTKNPESTQENTM